jgi:hypothetical protein
VRSHVGRTVGRSCSSAAWTSHSCRSAFHLLRFPALAEAPQESKLWRGNWGRPRGVQECVCVESPVEPIPSGAHISLRCSPLGEKSGALRRMASSNSSQARSAAFHEDNDSQNFPGWPLDKTQDNVFMIHPIFLHDHLPPRFKRWYLRFERWLRNEASAPGVCKPCRRV